MQRERGKAERKLGGQLGDPGRWRRHDTLTCLKGLPWRVECGA